MTLEEAMNPNRFARGKKYRFRTKGGGNWNKGKSFGGGPPKSAYWLPRIAVCDGFDGKFWRFHSAGPVPWKVTFTPAQMIGLEEL